MYYLLFFPEKAKERKFFNGNLIFLRLLCIKYNSLPHSKHRSNLSSVSIDFTPYKEVRSE
jgi:hypothetical protein